MQKINLMDKYPVYTKEIWKSKIKFKNTDEFIKALKEKIEADPIATFIWVFDHFSHTKNIWGEIDSNVIDAKIILYCFWKAITNPQMLAVRPRNLAIVEYEDKFIISFIEAPKEPTNWKIIGWVNDLLNN